MPYRRRLTPEFVDSLECPESGEKWISDTEVPGFGIRLWGGKTKGKSFSIRVNIKGKIIRRSIFPASGEDLGYARGVAKQEIAELKNPPLSVDFLKSISFENYAQIIIEKQRRESLPEQYVDDNWSRFSAYTSEIIKNKSISDITEDDIKNTLLSIKEKPSQLRNLRYFYIQIFNFAHKITGFHQFYLMRRKLEDKEKWSYEHKPFKYAFSDSLVKKNFQNLFKILENEKENPQLRDFVLLYFTMHGVRSSKRFLRAKVDEFQTKQIWYVKRNSKLNKKFREMRLTESSVALLERIKERNTKDFPNSAFLFPSSNSLKTGHLTSCKSYWSYISNKAGLPEGPIEHFLIYSYYRLMCNY